MTKSPNDIAADLQAAMKDMRDDQRVCWAAPELKVILAALRAAGEVGELRKALEKIADNGNNSFVYVLERQDPNVTPTRMPQSHRIGVADFARRALGSAKE